MPAAAAAVTSQEPVLPLDDLHACVRRLDAGSRALLDLSVRRGLPDDAMAPILRTDPFHLAWRRARVLERLADALGAPPLAAVRAALAELPDDAWSPLPQLTAPAAQPPPGLSLVVRETSAMEASAGGRLDRFVDGAPTLRGAFKGAVAAFCAAPLRLFVRRR